MDSPHKVLFVASEVTPLLKTGGLADVAGALPAALHRLGVDVRLLIPAYKGLLAATGAKPVMELSQLFPEWGRHTLCRGTLPGSDVVVYLLANPELYVRDGGPYQDSTGQDWPDNPQRFALLAATASMFADPGGLDGFQPEILHCNDWQTGLAPAYAKLHRLPVRSVLSIHNLAYQGNFDKAWIRPLGLDWSLFTMDGLEFHDQLSFLKAGIAFSDRILTVSPTYAEEIQTPDKGFGLDGILRSRRADLRGILNGIDTVYWDPNEDTLLAERYGPANLKPGKAANKVALQQELGLQPVTAPLLGMVSRLAWQKGADIVQDAAERLVAQGAQLAIVGAGDTKMAKRWRALAAEHRGHIGFFEGYSEPLAHLVEAGADIFLMPSRFEPCGLNQMYSQRYGTLPLVTATGGLADTVIGYDGERVDANGFVMPESTVEALLATVTFALATMQHRTIWRGLQRNAMRIDYSWGEAAAKYLAVYRELAST
jgi:starch synthase